MCNNCNEEAMNLSRCSEGIGRGRRKWNDVNKILMYEILKKKIYLAIVQKCLLNIPITELEAFYFSGQKINKYINKCQKTF